MFYDFVKFLFKDGSKDCKCLVKVVCFLYDVSWCVYFDYCVEICFDNVMCVNLGGFKYFECVFFGLVLFYCYCNKCEGMWFEELYDLFNDEDQKQVEIFGKVMCFGVMLWMQVGMDLGKLVYKVKFVEFYLEFLDCVCVLYGEVVEVWLQLLVSVFEVELFVSFF